MTKQHSPLNAQLSPHSPNLCALLGNTFGAAVGGFKVMALFTVSQEVLDASDCKEGSERNNMQTQSITLSLSNINTHSS